MRVPERNTFTHSEVIQGNQGSQVGQAKKEWQVKYLFLSDSTVFEQEADSSPGIEPGLQQQGRLVKNMLVNQEQAGNNQSHQEDWNQPAENFMGKQGERVDAVAKRI